MIYKYLSPERTQALQDATLRATQANALNDPFEIKPFFSSAFQRSELLERMQDNGMFEEELKKAFAALPDHRKPHLSPEQLMHFLNMDGVKEHFGRLLNNELDQFFDHHVPALTERLRDLMHTKLGCIVGIVSFSEDPTNQLMWAHYADSHKGFALGFDESHPYFDRRRTDADEFFHLRSVEYFDPLPVYSSKSELDGITKTGKTGVRVHFPLSRTLLVAARTSGKLLSKKCTPTTPTLFSCGAAGPYLHRKFGRVKSRFCVTG